MTTVINGTTGTSIAGDATIQGNLTVTGTLVGGVPSGAVFWFAASTAPTGYLKANGAAVSRATYSALFAVVGTTFGAGDGSTTFNLPNLLGEFIRGWDDGRGVDSGRVFGSSQAQDIQSHTHNVEGNNNTGTGGINRLSVVAQSIGFTPISNAAMASGGTETRPRNVALLPCIKT